MNDERIVDVPALLCVVDDLRQRFIGHSRVVLKRQRAHLRGVVEIAHQAGKGRDGADARVPARNAASSDETSKSCSWIRTAMECQPPVTGGNRATSSSLPICVVAVRQVVIHRDTHRPARRKLLGPDTAPRSQPGQQRADGADVAGQSDVLGRPAECISEPSKVDDTDHDSSFGTCGMCRFYRIDKNASGNTLASWQVKRSFRKRLELELNAQGDLIGFRQQTRVHVFSAEAIEARVFHAQAQELRQVVTQADAIIDAVAQPSRVCGAARLPVPTTPGHRSAHKPKRPYNERLCTNSQLVYTSAFQVRVRVRQAETDAADSDRSRTQGVLVVGVERRLDRDVAGPAITAKHQRALRGVLGRGCGKVIPGERQLAEHQPHRIGAAIANGHAAVKAALGGRTASGNHDRCGQQNCPKYLFFHYLYVRHAPKIPVRCTEISTN